MHAPLILGRSIDPHASAAPKTKPEKVSADHYGRFGRLWIDLEDAAEAVVAVTAKHARIAARLADPTLLDQFPVGSDERTAAENRVIALGFERGRLMAEFRKIALRIVRLWGTLPSDVQDGVIEQARAVIGASPAMEVAGADQAVMAQTVMRRIVAAWNKQVDDAPANAVPVPF